MTAMRKFIGGCLDGININYQNVEMVTGAMSKVKQNMKIICEREESCE